MSVVDPQTESLADFSRVLTPERVSRPAKISLDPEKVQNGMARLVLTLIELLRELLERQAIRRMEAGSLNDTEVERLGNAFCMLSRQMDDLCQTFDLKREDLNLDLGPLGKLI